MTLYAPSTAFDHLYHHLYHHLYTPSFIVGEAGEQVPTGAGLRPHTLMRPDTVTGDTVIGDRLDVQ